MGWELGVLNGQLSRRFGVVTGEVWEQFGNVRALGFDGMGRLYLYDSQAARITVVGPGGEFLRAFGRSGEGPREFRSADGLAVMRDGRVVMGDLGHRAYQIFDANGDFERMVRMAPEPGDVRLTALLADPGVWRGLLDRAVLRRIEGPGGCTRIAGGSSGALQNKEL